MEEKRKNNPIRVRFAPSPTGNLHIGGARTALFNWLFAKHSGGIFVLRIEDTDLERSDPKYEKDILEGLRWLGLGWDEGPDVGGPYGPYRQRERLDIYEKFIWRLLDEDKAYYCFCAKEELEAERQAQLAAGMAPRYSGKCRARNAKSGGYVIRFKVPEEKIIFRDLVRGEVTFDGSLFGDLAIAKDLRMPLYNFAVVIDDYEMKITHVIRAEEHLGNTPKQIFLQQALGLPAPNYAHIPLILDEKRAKMSKRHGATALMDYKIEGYLPAALMNFLSLLGWHPKTEGEVLPVDKIIEEFTLERVQKAGAVFDVEKLKWMNGEYIKKSEPAELLELVSRLYPEVAPKLSRFAEVSRIKIMNLAKDRMKTLKEFSVLSAFFFEIGDYDAELLIWKRIPGDIIKHNLESAAEVLSRADERDFMAAKLEELLKPLTDKLGRGEVLWPLRVALSGLEASPGPYDIMEVLGKTESLARIKKAFGKI